MHDHQLQGDFTRLLSERLGQRRGFSVQFVETPNKRAEEFIQRGRIHLICNNNPRMGEPAAALPLVAALLNSEQQRLNAQRN